jgi:hypothetical protein
MLPAKWYCKGSCQAVPGGSPGSSQKVEQVNKARVAGQQAHHPEVLEGACSLSLAFPAETFCIGAEQHLVPVAIPLRVHEQDVNGPVRRAISILPFAVSVKLSRPNILIHSLSGQSPKEVTDSEWLIVEGRIISAGTSIRPASTMRGRTRASSSTRTNPVEIRAAENRPVHLRHDY